MSKAGRKFNEGVRDVAAYLKGARAGYEVHVPDEVDVKAIRGKLGMSQARFAAAFGFNVHTLKGWEQKRRGMDPHVRVLLTVIDKEPSAVRRALSL
ncbi:MAG: helix-turn-helix domain-containing protein [Dongiaceae bacterium]